MENKPQEFKLKVNVDSTEIDAAIEKMERLIELAEKSQSVLKSVSVVKIDVDEISKACKKTKLDELRKLGGD